MVSGFVYDFTHNLDRTPIVFLRIDYVDRFNEYLIQKAKVLLSISFGCLFYVT